MVKTPVHEGAELWNGEERVIRVHGMKGAPLLDMSLLSGHRFTMDAVTNGPITIAGIA